MLISSSLFHLHTRACTRTYHSKKRRNRHSFRSGITVAWYALARTLALSSSAAASAFLPCPLLTLSSIYSKSQHRRTEEQIPFPPRLTSWELLVLVNSSDEESSTPKWQQPVVAKRPVRGNIVPKANRKAVRPSRESEVSWGGSAPPSLVPQGVRKVDSKIGSSSSSPPSSPSNLRITGGMAKGRRLDSPQLVHLRPMMSKVKEAVFSTLASVGVYDPSLVPSCRHLDIFAGSGSVGLESLSRGAQHCTFVDSSDDCCRTIQRNLVKCQFEQQSSINSSNRHYNNNNNNRQHHVICANAFSVLRNSASYDWLLSATQSTLQPQPFDIVTLCPPYEEVVYSDLMEAVVESPLVGDDTIVVVEYPVELESMPHVIGDSTNKKLIGIRNRRYGRTVIAMYICNPTGKLQEASSRPQEFISI